MSDDRLYDVARRATDEVLGYGSYARMNAGNPDPRVQAAIARARDVEPTRVEQLGFWDRLGLDESMMPIHLPMPLTKEGHGPADPDDADHLGCWCADPQCILARAFAEAFELGRASRD